jgi:protein tyrosine/serine phosphatase
VGFDRIELRRLRATAVLVGLTLALSAVPGAAGKAATANIRIDNFGQVNATYYRGAQPEGRDYADLAALGVKTVIDLTDDANRDEPAGVRAAGMTLIRIPMSTHETPSAEKIAQFLAIVDDPAKQPVYVHCQGGRHRTGVMTAVYRMTDEGWTADRAFSEMKSYKFGADFLHSEFKKFVFTYHPVVKPADKLVTTEAAAKLGN